MKFLLVIPAAYLALLLWDWHGKALSEARQHGHADVWRIICERHPKVGNRLLAEIFDDPELDGLKSIHCSDFDKEE